MSYRFNISLGAVLPASCCCCSSSGVLVVLARRGGAVSAAVWRQPLPYLDPRISNENAKILAICFTYRARVPGCLCESSSVFILPAPSLPLICVVRSKHHPCNTLFFPVVQVLHLMNKMNLPCPFGQVTARPPMVSSWLLGTEGRG